MSAPTNLRTTSLLLSLTLFAGCAVNPVTGRSEFAITSASKELEIGKLQYGPSQQSQGGKFTADETLVEYVSEVGQRLAAVSKRSLPYEFVIINDSVPNAWALPGGKIAVNRGLLLELSNESELAAVLGHEVVHAAARHGAQAMDRGMLLQGGLLLTSIAVHDSEFANEIVGGAKTGLQLISHKYGRDAERESDIYGIEYMVDAGYDPVGAVTLQETFVRLSGERRKDFLEGLFASHPPSAERVDNNRKKAAEYPPGGELGEVRFREKTDFLRRTKPAYSAFDQSASLATVDTDAALAAIDRAIGLLPTEPRFHGRRGDILMLRQKYTAADEAFSAALEMDDSYYEYYLGKGLANSQLGNRREARTLLDRANELLPTAVAMSELGKLSLVDGRRSDAKQYFRAAARAGGQVGREATSAFIRLDLPDDPTQYIVAEAIATNGQVFAVVTNRSPLPLREVRIVFRAIANGEAITRAVSMKSLAAGERTRATAGWQFQQSDVVTEISARVAGATL